MSLSRPLSRTYSPTVSDGEWLVGEMPLALYGELRDMTDAERAAFLVHWRTWGRYEQHAPPGDWRIWMIMAGRGFGKTRAGAEWVRDVAAHDPGARIALVAANIHEARAVMVEGASGIIAVTRTAPQPHYEPSLKRLTWANGAKATLFSAAEPDHLRGPEHSHVWCDEIAKWDRAPVGTGSRAEAAWDNMMMGLRAGACPQVVATTTPRAVPLVLKLARGQAGLARDELVLTHGATFANANNLPQSYLAMMQTSYGASQLGRQELDGELMLDIEGALWSRDMLARCRVDAPGAAGLKEGQSSPRSQKLKENYTRIVVAVDPPAGSRGDACGIIVAGLHRDGSAHVLDDCSVEKPAPMEWAAAAAAAADDWGVDRVLAESNQGGEMVRITLHAAGLLHYVDLIHASRGKTARAEPVAALYEAGRVRHMGHFPALEDEMCGMMAGGEYTGPGRSPDRADALVYALTALLLNRRVPPRVLMW